MQISSNTRTAPAVSATRRRSVADRSRVPARASRARRRPASRARRQAVSNRSVSPGAGAAKNASSNVPASRLPRSTGAPVRWTPPDRARCRAVKPPLARGHSHASLTRASTRALAMPKAHAVIFHPPLGPGPETKKTVARNAHPCTGSGGRVGRARERLMLSRSSDVWRRRSFLPLGMPGLRAGLSFMWSRPFPAASRVDMTRSADLVAAMIQQRKRLRFVLSSI